MQWQTPFGFVKTDDVLTNKFLADFNIKEQPLIFENEHAINGIIPFIKYYFPEATILPIILNSYTDISEVNKLSKWLGENLDSKTLIIYSIDFSHYLAKEEAEKKDELTKEAIINNDLSKIMKFNNDYVDSPSSLVTALTLAKAMNWQINFIYHSNSFDLAPIKNYQTTSHFVISFTK
jgi:MEMO1 family protein